MSLIGSRVFLQEKFSELHYFRLSNNCLLDFSQSYDIKTQNKLVNAGMPRKLTNPQISLFSKTILPLVLKRLFVDILNISNSSTKHHFELSGLFIYLCLTYRDFTAAHVPGALR